MSTSLIGIAGVAVLIAAWLAWALRRSGIGAALAAALAVPVAALAVYLALGTPQLGDLPLAARDDPAVMQAQEDIQFRQMTGVLVERLQEEPDNIKGWTMLASAYGHMKEWTFAADAQRRVIALKKDAVTAEDWAELAEILVQATDGRVGLAASQAIAKALTLDPNQPHARHYQALGKAQAGDVAAAVSDWQALLDDALADSEWRPVITGYMSQAKAHLARQNSDQPAEAQPRRGPSPADMAAAQQMSPEERQAMIETMVEGLAERLRDEPGDPSGWLRLAGAYTVLGRKGDAASALDQAEAVATAQLAEAAPGKQPALQAIIDRAAVLRQQL
jgi:cytochrome c-type biogenesis protein CcmH